MALRAVRLHTPHILEDIVVLLCYIAWGIVRLRYAGMDLSQIVTTSALITAVVAFAMQDTLGNLLGGVALELDASLNVGDWVRVDDVEGQVIDIRWRSTSIQTRNWDTVVVPNSQLMRNKFTIHGRRKGAAVQWRRWIWFNVDYTAPPARVIETVETAIRAALISHVGHATRRRSVIEPDLRRNTRANRPSEPGAVLIEHGYCAMRCATG